MVLTADPLITFRRVPEHAGIHREALEEFARVLSRRVASGRAFHCLITGDAELRRLNARYLSQDYATDVLSFPSSANLDPETSSTASIGDLAISRQRAFAQANEFGHTIHQELQLLMLHGVLHLIGMDHEKDRGAMARAERSWRAKLDLPSSLTERVRSRTVRTQRSSARASQ